jgi:cytochrome bd-type quinol oxidase subunit 1
MHYPWWYVPHLTAPMLIAVVAVVHVLVSHYAVGGGLFLAVETGHAYREGDRSYLAYLKRHARFFILLTVVFGAITGVGIWWTIGLASPLATEVLIRTFVFGWATEWVFFCHRDRRGLHLLLLLGPAGGKNAPGDRMDLRAGRVD